VTWTLVFTRRARKDARKIREAGLRAKVEGLLEILRENPFQNPPPYEKLIGDLLGAYSRRINIQHRLVYQVYDEARTVKVLRMWTHYEWARAASGIFQTMPAKIQPRLEPGKVYRTRDLRTWGANLARLARRLIEEGELRPLAHGLFYHPKRSRFGPVPPEDAEIVRGFLGNDDFVLTGSPYWNAVGLGAQAVFPVVLVYNRERTGEFRLGARRYQLRRVRFPDSPDREWYAVDLLEHHRMAGVSPSRLEAGLRAALREHRLDPETLRSRAREYATRKTQTLVDRAIDTSRTLAPGLGA
jgi:Txe/YoeB family toxin of toxin-antitoxin system